MLGEAYMAWAGTCITLAASPTRPLGPVSQSIMASISLACCAMVAGRPGVRVLPPPLSPAQLIPLYEGARLHSS